MNAAEEDKRAFEYSASIGDPEVAEARRKARVTRRAADTAESLGGIF